MEWTHSLVVQLWSRLKLDIVITEGKEVLTAVTVAAAEAQQMPQGTGYAYHTVNSYLSNLCDLLYMELLQRGLFGTR